MITIISGAPGAGKSSLNAFFIITAYENEGRTLLKRSTAKIEELNKSRLHPLTPPVNPPIFSDFRAKFLVGLNKYFEPYFINGYRFGLSNERIRVQYLPPYSKVFLGEAQRYYNSRKSASFPDFVSRLYEMHRHYELDIYLDVQRTKLIDPNIRELCRRFIEVQRMEHEHDELGRIVKTVWHCREFSNNIDFEEYSNTGAETFKETTYTYYGNIFDCYDSFNFFSDFLPEDDGRNDFSYLKHLTRSERHSAPKDIAEFYSGEPTGYRKAVSEKSSDKK